MERDLAHEDFADADGRGSREAVPAEVDDDLLLWLASAHSVPTRGDAGGLV